ncbi:unnamed protein product [Spirodela intermedia]|uniref:procollagen-proline 4-dioxygenase n=1 Tax=Spirodela intermedia TaxID=51605 RepID=A0A7I8J966_SPIIN|nr:unnamed protein product [Spirodela intermedia]CAA6666727.1 unnamed protein product [Spirodela intermedia]
MARPSVRSSRVFSGRRSASPVPLVLGLLLMMSIVLLVLLALGILSLPVSADSSKLKPVVVRGLKDASDETKMGATESDELWDREEQWSEILSWEPRASLYHNFLSKAECEHLIQQAKPRMHKSTVVDSKTGKSMDSRVRTSSGTFLKRGRDKIVQHGEGLQILHYEVGQKYEPHYDYFLDEFNTKNGGQRIATVLMYLSDVEEGGETIFPAANVNSSSLPYYSELSECGRRGLGVKPKMGDALLFWSMRPDATLDSSSLHGGCPVIRGNKWSSTKWLHVREYRT